MEPQTQNQFNSMIKTHDYIENFSVAPAHELDSDVAESSDDIEIPNTEGDRPAIERRRADVPKGPDEKDKRVPVAVAQGD